MTRGAWDARLSESACARIAEAVVAQEGLEARPAVLVHDLSMMEAKFDALAGAFPEPALHAVAVKANPVVEILRRLVARGAGLECASIEEVEVALRADAPPSRVVFDSPAKTRRELVRALELGVMINADGFEELERLDAIVARQGPPRGPVGLRINPMVGAGRIAATSVGARVSKFGVPLEGALPAVVEAFERRPWLVGVHAHVGSQGCDLALLVRAASKVGRLVEAIEARAPGQLRDVDLGGGLPVVYREGDQAPSVREYVAALREACPALMDGRVRLVTEFGRSIHANCGLGLSRVEYVKRLGETPTAVVHLGADLLLRPVYNPADWSHEFVALDAKGRLKAGPRVTMDIAGPLCFGGDFIGRGVKLPALEPGDILGIRDVGAYTLSMWSRHCSRGQPPVLGWRGDDGSLSLLRAGETPAQVAAQWDLPGASS